MIGFASFFVCFVFSGEPLPALDFTRLAHREEPYRIVYRGRIVGCIDYFLDEQDNALVWSGLEGTGPNNRRETLLNWDLDQDLWQLKVSSLLAKEPAQLEMVMAEDGSIAYRKNGGEILEKSLDAKVPVFEHDVFLFFLIRALDLTQDVSYQATLIDSDTLEGGSFSVEQTGSEKVLLPLGTFDAFRIAVQGKIGDRQLDRTVYLSKTRPVRVLKVHFIQENLQYELLPKTLEQVLLELQSQRQE